jgi:hypothetical protein
MINMTHAAASAIAIRVPVAAIPSPYRATLSRDRGPGDGVELVNLSMAITPRYGWYTTIIGIMPA